MRLTQSQYNSTLKLARAFGHEWARVAESSNLFGPGNEFAPTTELIAALVGARHAANPRFEPWQAGISCPEMEESDVLHTTGTGRLRWLVNSEGNVTIYINRPELAEMIRVFVYPEREVTAPVPKEQWGPDWNAGGVQIYLERIGLVRRRHVETAIEAVAALVGEEKALLAFSGLLEVVPEEAGAKPAPASTPEPTEPPAREITEYTLSTS